MTDRSTAAGSTALAPTPQLVFRMVGTWWRIDLSAPSAITESTREIARAVLGRADEHTTARARLRSDLADAATAAVSADAQLMMIQTEIGPGQPMSTTLTVFEDTSVRMSPAIGTSEDAVLSVFEESLALMDGERAASAVRRRSADSEVVRVHEIEESVESEDGASFTRRRLIAQYWYPIPGTKRLLLAVFTTPLGDIPHSLLSYFDAIVGVSSFRAA